VIFRLKTEYHMRLSVKVLAALFLTMAHEPSGRRQVAARTPPGRRQDTLGRLRTLPDASGRFRTTANTLSQDSAFAEGGAEGPRRIMFDVECLLEWRWGLPSY